MAQLYFRYGTMNAGKSIELLKIAHNYEEQGKSVLLFSPATDTRSGVNCIKSRIGIEHESMSITKDDNIFDIVTQNCKTQSCHCVLIDEAQFLDPKHILECVSIVDELNIPVIAFGLKNDFRNQLFPSSRELLIHADKLDEIKTVCVDCTRKASMNLKLNAQGQPDITGGQVEVGDNDTYLSVCRKHYNIRMWRRLV